MLSSIFPKKSEPPHRWLGLENDRFILLNTSMCLRMVGCDYTPITLPVSGVKKAIEKHKLSKEEIITSLAQLYYPILIFDSDREHTTNNVDSKLIFTTEVSKYKMYEVFTAEWSLQKMAPI